MKTINEIGQQHRVHPLLVGQWNKEVLERAVTLFEDKRSSKPTRGERAEEGRIYEETGRLNPAPRIASIEVAR